MQKIRIAVSEWVPWIKFGENKSFATAQGVLVELYKGLKQANFLDYELQMATAYGVLGPDKKWTGMVGSMVRNETDIGGPFFVDANRAQAVKFVSPLDFSQLVMATGLVPANKHPFLIFKIFSMNVWLSFMSSIIFVAGITSLIYIILPFSHKKKKTEALIRYMWLFLTSLIGKDFGTKNRWFLQPIWNTPSLRFVLSVWLMTCLVFVNSYQGSIISTYAAFKLKPKYENLDDLMKDKSLVIGTYANSFPYLCLKRLINTTFEPVFLRAQENLLYVGKGLPPWMDPVEQGSTVVVGETGHTKYLIGERFKLTGKCGIRVIPLDFCAAYIALGSRKELSSTFINKFNIGIQRFNEGGISTRQKTESILFYEICTQTDSSTAHPLNLTDLIGAFAVLGIGLALSIIYFVLELLTTWSQGRKLNVP
ncbi:lig_chan-Glu_bd domain-containing protein [Nephila pilipes]|uniref:Lig_chan-Glu_bd domain-containing protein n=1 Tax=Nephila pilipes TaxID=299642 RepID=A0A8X6UIK8_NEPPI|nr:lig_chan-Glu_bd domain-containing protein [Nephila pilipes]